MQITTDAGHLKKNMKYIERFEGVDFIEVILQAKNKYLAFQEASQFKQFV